MWKKSAGCTLNKAVRSQCQSQVKVLSFYLTGQLYCSFVAVVCSEYYHKS